MQYSTILTQRKTAPATKYRNKPPKNLSNDINTIEVIYTVTLTDRERMMTPPTPELLGVLPLLLPPQADACCE